MAKQMTAQYRSRCSKCGGAVVPGVEIMYEKGAGSWHVACPAKAAPTPAAAKVPVSDAPFQVSERWDPCTRAAQDSRLAAVVGETRRYTLGPATRPVRAVAATPRQRHNACQICGAARNDLCTPPAGAETKEESTYIQVDPTKRGTWEMRHVCILPAVPAHAEPVPDDRRRSRLPALREGAAAEAHEGVYTVVGAGDWRFQNATDNEDMGDMQGANWSGILYLRAATPEEVAADTAKRWEAAMPAILDALGKGFDARDQRLALEQMAALQKEPGYVRAEVGYVAALNLSEDDQATRAATVKTLWSGKDRDYSYVKVWTWRGQQVMEHHHYVYDWDLPTVYVGPTALVGQAEIALAVVALSYGIQRCMQRLEKAA